MNEYLTKGRPVLIEARLRFQTLETEDGQTRRKHDVVVEPFSFVSERQHDGGCDAQQGDTHPATTSGSSEDDIPF